MKHCKWHAYRSISTLQVRFHEVSENELEEMRTKFRTGEMQIKIEDAQFSMRCQSRTNLESLIYNSVHLRMAAS